MLLRLPGAIHGESVEATTRTALARRLDLLYEASYPPRTLEAGKGAIYRWAPHSGRVGKCKPPPLPIWTFDENLQKLEHLGSQALYGVHSPIVYRVEPDCSTAYIP